MSSRRKKDPPEYVPRSFCDERTRRIEEKMASEIKAAKNEIIKEIKNHSSIPWSAKATIIAAFILAVASIYVAYIR